MSVNLLITGRSGNGKSSTVNSIFGEKVFDERSVLESPNISVQMKDNLSINGEKASVVELPCLDHESSADVKSMEMMLTKIKNTLETCQTGFHAILIVLKYGSRFTKQEQDAIKMVKSVFGINAIKSHGVIIMTHGDNFAAYMEEENQTFEEWCQSQSGQVQALFQECGSSRCVMFNNRAKDAETRTAQRDRLLSVVKELISKMSPYTLKEYEEAEGEQNKLLVTIKLPKLEEETKQTMADLHMELDILSQNNSSEGRYLVEMNKKLPDLQERLTRLKTHLKDEDRGTNVFNLLLAMVGVTERTILTKIKLTEAMRKKFQPWQVVKVQDNEVIAEECWDLLDELKTDDSGNTTQIYTDIPSVVSDYVLGSESANGESVVAEPDQIL